MAPPYLKLAGPDPVFLAREILSKVNLCYCCSIIDPRDPEAVRKRAYLEGYNAGVQTAEEVIAAVLRASGFILEREEDA